METPQRLSILDAAPILGVSPYTLRGWLQKGRISYHRLGTRIVLDRVDLEGYLAQHRVPAREESPR